MVLTITLHMTEAEADHLLAALDHYAPPCEGLLAYIAGKVLVARSDEQARAARALEPTDLVALAATVRAKQKENTQ